MKKILLVGERASAIPGLKEELRKRGKEAELLSLPPMASWRRLLLLGWQFRSRRPSLVYWQLGPRGASGALRAARWAKVPYVLFNVPALAGPADRLVADIAALSRRKEAYFLCETADDLRTLEAAAPAVKGACAVIPGPYVSLARFCPPREERMLLETQPVRIVYAQRLGPGCGVGELRQAASILRARRLSFEMIVAGEPAGLEGDLVAWRKEGGVKLPGRVEAVDALLRGGEIAVATSPKPGLSRFLVEAAAAARAIACADTPGARRLFEHGKSALFHRPGDASQLARNLERLLKEPELRAALGAAAREAVSQQDEAQGLRLLRKVIESLVD